MRGWPRHWHWGLGLGGLLPGFCLLCRTSIAPLPMAAQEPLAGHLLLLYTRGYAWGVRGSVRTLVRRGWEGFGGCTHPPSTQVSWRRAPLSHPSPSSPISTRGPLRCSLEVGFRAWRLLATMAWRPSPASPARVSRQHVPHHPDRTSPQVQHCQADPGGVRQLHRRSTRAPGLKRGVHLHLQHRPRRRGDPALRAAPARGGR